MLKGGAPPSGVPPRTAQCQIANVAEHRRPRSLVRLASRGLACGRVRALVNHWAVRCHPRLPNSRDHAFPQKRDLFEAVRDDSALFAAGFDLAREDVSRGLQQSVDSQTGRTHRPSLAWAGRAARACCLSTAMIRSRRPRSSSSETKARRLARRRSAPRLSRCGDRTSGEARVVQSSVLQDCSLRESRRERRKLFVRDGG